MKNICWANKFSLPLPTSVGPTNVATYFFLPSLSSRTHSHPTPPPARLASTSAGRTPSPTARTPPSQRRGHGGPSRWLACLPRPDEAWLASHNEQRAAPARRATPARRGTACSPDKLPPTRRGQPTSITARIAAPGAPLAPSVGKRSKVRMTNGTHMSFSTRMGNQF